MYYIWFSIFEPILKNIFTYALIRDAQYTVDRPDLCYWLFGVSVIAQSLSVTYEMQHLQTQMQ